MHQDEINFVNAVSMIAYQHECVIEDLDIDKRIIKLGCSKGNEDECARAIREFVETAER